MSTTKRVKAEVIAQATESLAIIDIECLGICVSIGVSATTVIRCSSVSAAYQLVADLTSEDYEILLPTTK